MTDAATRKILLELAAERDGEATFCPSEAARRLQADWRPLMSQVREAAAVLVEEGRLVCTQRGKEVNPREAKGPIRLAGSSRRLH